MSSLKETPKTFTRQKNAKHVNEFAVLQCFFKTLNLLKPTVGKDSFEVLLQNIGMFVREVRNDLKDYTGHA
jgi:hypothetical protein